jgi:hypothetical protein
MKILDLLLEDLLFLFIRHHWMKNGGVELRSRNSSSSYGAEFRYGGFEHQSVQSPSCPSLDWPSAVVSQRRGEETAGNILPFQCSGGLTVHMRARLQK